MSAAVVVAKKAVKGNVDDDDGEGEGEAEAEGGAGAGTGYCLIWTHLACVLRISMPTAKVVKRTFRPG